MADATETTNHPGPDVPASQSPLRRRSFLKLGLTASTGVVLSQAQAWGNMVGFLNPINIQSPFDAYPNRDWEQAYRDLYKADSTFHFLCAPNDTHNCLLTAYVKNGVVVRTGPSFGYGKATDVDGNQASHRWDPRCCQKGLALVRRFYGDRRVKAPMVRTGFKNWVEAGFPREEGSGKIPEQYLNRGREPFVQVTWDEAFNLAARAMKNIAETYNGPAGTARLTAQGYDAAMVAAVKEAGVQTLKFRGGMAALGATRLFAQYRLANMMALLDAKSRKVEPDKAVGARGWDNYSWHTDLPPGHPMVTGHQTVDWDLSAAEHASLILVWGMNWITTKMPDSHWLTEARLKGTKVITIAAEYSATASKSDAVLIVRPGTTPALALGLIHVIIKEGLYDAAYIRQATDLPLLVRDDTHELLRAQDVFPNYTLQPLKHHVTVVAKGERPPIGLQQAGPVVNEDMRTAWGDYVVYNSKSQTLQALSRDHVGQEFDKLGITPALEGTFTAKLVHGQSITVRPVFEHIKTLVMESYDPATVSEITWAPVEAIQSIARQIAQHAGQTLFAMGMGPNQFFNNDLKDRAVFLLASLTRSIGRIGGNVGSYAGNYRAAYFNGLVNYFIEDPFNIVLDPQTPVQQRPYFQYESVHYWNHGDNVLRMGKTLLTGASHIPTPTKSIHVSNSNSLIGNAKGHYDTVINTLRKTEFVAVNEWWWTASCEYADIVFAVDSWAEMKLPDATISVTNPFLYIYPDTPLPRIYDTRSDLEVAAGIGTALGKLIDEPRCAEYWHFVGKDQGKTYLRRVLEASNMSRGYNVDKLIKDAQAGIPAPMLTRTYPKVGMYEQGTEGKSGYTKTGRLEFYREEAEFRDSGENLPVHREPIDSTFYEPNVIVAKPHPLLRPKTPEDYGVAREDLSADTRQARHVIKAWADLKHTQHPLMQDGFNLIFHTPKYRHGAHTTAVDTDIVAVWFGPFGDMHRTDKRAPFVAEAYVDIHPLDAKALGLEDGDYVYIDGDPHHSPYSGWKPEDAAYKMSRLMARCRYYPGTPRGVARMWHNMYGATFGSYTGHVTRPDGLAKNPLTGYQAMFRSGSHQSCTRGYLKPTWMTDSLVRKNLIGQVLGQGFAADVHCPTGAPRESIVKITKAEDGGLNGQGLWEPAKKGLRPTYENEALKRFIAGGYVQQV